MNEGVITIRGILSRIKKISMEETELSKSKAKGTKQNSTIVSLDKKTQLKNTLLLINGKSFEIIKSNEYLFNHFCFILYIFKGLIGFNMEPHQKADLLKIIKMTIFQNSICLAVGDGYDDLEMLQESDCSVEISKINEKLIFNLSYQADIYCGDYNYLNSLIFACSKGYGLKIENILVYLTYSSSLMTASYFYFFWYSHFNGFFFLESFHFFYQNSFQFIIPSIFYFIYGEEFNQKILLIFPAIYKDSKSTKANLLKNLIKGIISAFFDSIIIYFFGFFFLYIKNGTNSNFIFVSSNIYVLNNIFCFYYFVFKIKRIWFTVFFSTFVVLFFFILGIYFAELTYHIDAFNDNILHNLPIILFDHEIFFLNIFLCFFWSTGHFLIENYVEPFIFKSNYSKIQGLIDQSF